MTDAKADAVFQRTTNIADRYIEAITAAVEQSRRPSTRRAYSRAWARFERWADAEGLQSLPSDPVTVAAYFAHRAAEGLSPATLAMDRKAISQHHRSRGHANPTASEGVKLTLAGLRNQAFEEGRGEPRQAQGLTAAALDSIRATAWHPRTGPTGRRESVDAARRRAEVDIAIASVMRDALLRRGEAAGLRWDAVEFWGDGSARVTIRRSKTTNGSALLYIGREAADDLRRIRPVDVCPRDRVFGFRCGRSISNRIAAMARAAGLGDGFSGHSPRIGMAQDLTAAGVGLPAIMVAGRWKSERMPAYYSRGQAAGRGAVARYYGE